MERYPISDHPTRQQIDACHSVNIYPRNFQIFASREDWGNVIGPNNPPPMNPARRMKLWRDEDAVYGMWDTRWYIFASNVPLPIQAYSGGPDNRLPDIGLLDRVFFGIFPTTAAFYQTNAKTLAFIPRVKIVPVKREVAADLNFGGDASASFPVPLGFLTEDPVGPIDFIHGNTLADIDYVQAPAATHYQAVGIPSEIALAFDPDGSVYAFRYVDYKPPAWPGALLTDDLIAIQAQAILNRTDLALSGKGLALRKMFARD